MSQVLRAISPVRAWPLASPPCAGSQDHPPVRRVPHLLVLVGWVTGPTFGTSSTTSGDSQRRHSRQICGGVRPISNARKVKINQEI